MNGIRRLITGLVFLTAALVPMEASAQETMIEAHVGGLRFVDESGSSHRAVGVAARRYVKPRLALGLGATHLDGSGRARILYFQGLVTLDLTASRSTSFVPYLSLSAGLMHHSNEFRVASPWTGAVDVMVGLRMSLSDRWFVAPEAGLGLTSLGYSRFGVSLGFRR